MIEPIHLTPLSKENWETCAALRVMKDQEENIPSNLESIAELQWYPQTKAFAIMKEDVVIGFATWGVPDEGGAAKIFRFMIDQSFQQKGYGKRAFRLLLENVFEEINTDSIQLCYHPKKEEIKQFYASFGFVEKELLPCKRNVEGKMVAELMREDWKD